MRFINALLRDSPETLTPGEQGIHEGYKTLTLGGIAGAGASVVVSAIGFASGNPEVGETAGLLAIMFSASAVLTGLGAAVFERIGQRRSHSPEGHAPTA